VHEQLRQVIAAGFSPPANFAVSKAVWVNHGGPLDPFGVASALKAVVGREKPDLVILGKQAIDDDQNQVGQYLAEWLGWSQATFASKEESFESEAEQKKVPALVLSDDKKSLKVVREVDGGLAILQCTLPAVVTTDLRLCKEMRYSSLPGIMKAKTRPIEELTPAALGVDLTPKVSVVKLSSPPARKAGIKVPDVATLVQKLKTEAKVV
jgi:electron transfer flavoprotein beta subunit